MTRDVLLSLLLHLVIVTATVISAPFDINRKLTYDEVIQVSLTSLSEIAPTKPEPVSIPEMLPEEWAEIPIESPSTAKEAIVKPKEKTHKPRTKKTNLPATEGEKKEIEAPATGSGSRFQGATIDNVSFDYPYWFTEAFRKIEGNFYNPVVYDGTLVCVVYFQVIRSGRIVESRVEASSGVPAFDNACLQAIERSAPFPPLPREFRDEIIGITVPFKNR